MYRNSSTLIVKNRFERGKSSSMVGPQEDSAWSHIVELGLPEVQTSAKVYKYRRKAAPK